MNWKQRQHSFTIADKDRAEDTGLVFDIQRFAVHDGGGIRTLIFLKGCPLQCKWCQNPESMSSQPELMYIPHNCISCNACSTHCSSEAITLSSDEKITIDPALCSFCGECVKHCYAGSMTMVGRYLTVAEVMTEIERDMHFYAESGGGVTFSGGEPTLQGDFLLQCLKACKEKGLHTAIETCGQAPWLTFEKLLPYLDLVLSDIKLMDSVKHKECTGVGNELILANIQRLSEAGIPLTIRLPLIPDVNDDTENIEATARFVQSLSTAQGLDVLPYHRLGEPKWHQLGRTYPMAGVVPHTKETIVQKTAVAKRYIDSVNVGG